VLNFPPRPFQVGAIEKALTKKEFAMFSEMGTGKTYMTINIAWTRFCKGEIKDMLIVCDNSIKGVWEVEFEKHLKEPINLFNFTAGSKAKFNRWCSESDDRLRVLLIGVEALSQGASYDTILPYPDDNTMMVIDESYSIKTPGSKRTQRCWTLGSRAEYRMILTGTPMGDGYKDFYSQYKFLNTKILQCSNVVTFNRNYVIEGLKRVGGGKMVSTILGYKNEDKLLELIAPYTFQIKKSEALPDLPPKEFLVVPVEPTKEQTRALDDLKRNMEAEDSGDILEISTILERTVRFQQIAGGHFPSNDNEIRPISGKNPKMVAMMDYISHLPPDAKVIIWAQFVPEIKMIVDALSGVVEFYGAISLDQRKENTKRFQEDPSCRFMVSNRTGAKGQTWTAATYVLYYSNDYSYVNRIQSEDRAHRDGQNNKVMYVDFILQHELSDIAIHHAIQRKQSLADYASANLQEFM